MTSLRFATAVHIMVLLAHENADSAERAAPSRELASSIGVNAVVVRRIMGSLAEAELIHTRSGAQGGAWLARPPAKIRMSEIYAAVEDAPSHGSRPQGNKDCPVGRAAPGIICGLVRSIDEAARTSLAKTTLAQLVKTVEAAVA
jgi:Rrf2 family protein